MKAINLFVSSLLGIVTAALAALFWLGDAEQHQGLLQIAFWTAFAGRFLSFAAFGLVGAIIWWGVNGMLIKARLIKDAEMGQTALVLALGPLAGAFLGTLIFCFV